MGKRAPQDEPLYDPLGAVLVQEVLGGSGKPYHVADAGAKASVADRAPGPPRPEQKIVSLPTAREEPEAPRPAPEVGPEKLSLAPPIRVLLPINEREDLDQLVARLAKELGTRVKLSHLIRACLALLRHSEEEILKRARRARGMVRPPNSESIALAEFEDQLTDLLDAAFHDAPPRRSGARQ
jgi:hypothetical protein